MYFNNHRKTSHSRYNRERWIRRKRSSFHPTDSNRKDDGNSAIKDMKENKIENQKNQIDTSREQIRKLKKQVREEKKNLKSEKKTFRKKAKQAKKAGKKHLGIFSSLIVCIFFTFGILLLASALWLYRTWPNLKLDELIYEATSPLQGTGGGMVAKYIREAAVPALIALIFVVITLVWITKKGKKARRTGKSIICVTSAACIAVSGISFWERLDVGTYLKNQNSKDDFIASEYVDPAKTEITFPEKKRNLIYIYLESMEMTYADQANGGAFDQNVIPELTKLSEKNNNFSGGHSKLNGAHSLPGTTWTMGGMFAETSGLPLQVSIQANDLDTQTSFFPGIVTIGDLLKNQGYQNIFECGSDSSFGGRQLYFKNHGNYEVHDLFYYKQQGILPMDYRVWWGFEDEKLIQYAKNELSDLGKSGKPFNYTMLTADTHFEDGYLCRLCRNDFPGNQYANVMACSSRQITELVSWIQKQPWYENTTIVISGDHPTMDKDFCNGVDKNYERRVYTAYINAAPVENKSEGYRNYSTFDDFPTTLAALGCSIQGDRLGLGTNLYSGEKTLIERLGLENASAGVSRKSEFMMQKSHINQNSKELLEKEGVSPTGTVRLENYDAKTGEAKLSVSDIFYTSQKVAYVTADIVQNDRSIHSVKFKKDEYGVYHGTVKIPDQNPDNVNLAVVAHESGKNKTDQTETLLSYKGNLFLISRDQKDFDGLLKGINQLDLNRYKVFIATQGKAQKYLTGSEKQQLEKLGIPEKVLSTKNDAYAAVISDDGITLRKGTGTISFDGELSDGNTYTLTAADSDSQKNASIRVGSNVYSTGDNGYHIVIWDLKEKRPVLQYSFDSSTIGLRGNVVAKMNQKTDKINIVVTKLKGIPWLLDIKAVVGNKKTHTESEVLMSKELNKKKYTGSINLKGTDPDDLYVRLYCEDLEYKWWPLGPYPVKEQR